MAALELDHASRTINFAVARLGSLAASLAPHMTLAIRVAGIADLGSFMPITQLRVDLVRTSSAIPSDLVPIVTRISVSALVCRGLRQPSHGLHGRPRASARHTHVGWAADICSPPSREHLWTAAVRSAYTPASSAVVHPIMSLHSSHQIGDHCIDLGVTAVATAYLPRSCLPLMSGFWSCS